MRRIYTLQGLEQVYIGEFEDDLTADSLLNLTSKVLNNTYLLDDFATETKAVRDRTTLKEVKGHVDGFMNGALTEASYAEMFPPNAHVFGTFVAKGGPYDSTSGTFYCQGACDLVQYWRTINPVYYSELGELVVYNGQWHYKHRSSYSLVDFVYPNNYLSRDLGDNRGYPQGPFSPHGIGIDYVPLEDPCVQAGGDSPAYGDDLNITDVVFLT